MANRGVDVHGSRRFMFTDQLHLTICSPTLGSGMKTKPQIMPMFESVWQNMCNCTRKFWRVGSRSKTQLVTHVDTHVNEMIDPLNIMPALHTSALIDMDSFGPSERVLIEEWKRKFRQSKCYGEAVFVLGAMGAGKSTVITQEFRKHKLYGKYAYVDTDELMQELDGFDPDNVEEFYPTARGVAIYLTDWLLDENISFVAEGTCVKYDELEDYMKRLKQRGYSIKVKHVNNLSVNTVIERARRRHRKVPDEVVKSIYFGSLNGLNELKRINQSSDFTLFEEI